MPDLPYGIPPPGYRLPAATHVGSVRLAIGDLSRSVTYYTRLLGLTVIDRADDTAALGAPDRRVLVRLHEERGIPPAPPQTASGLYHFAILLPDRAALGRFTAHVLRSGARVGTADHLVSEALYLTDPDGLGIEVYADRPRSSWAQRDRELMMSTDPLDVDGVLLAGSGAAWEGVPAGTVMGHVHLRVGDLDAAGAFYHRALGLDKVVWSSPGALFLSAGGYHHHLGTNTWWRGPRAAEGRARLLDWELVLPDAADAAAAARSVHDAGYSAFEGEDGWTVNDPWGTRLRLAHTTGSRVADAASLSSG